MQLGISYSEITKGQESDKELSNLLQEANNLKWVSYNVEGRPLQCEISVGRARPYLPVFLRKIAFNNIHNLSHPSGRSTVRLMTERYIWKNMKSEIKKWY